MNKTVFKLSSEQLTLLTAFEETKGLVKIKANPKAQSHHFFDEKSILLVINAQAGLLDHKNKRHVIHVKHISDNPGSIFYKGSLEPSAVCLVGFTANKCINAFYAKVIQTSDLTR